MLDFTPVVHPRSQVSSNCSLKNFYHEREQRPREGRIPPSLRLFISDERMLGLNLKKRGSDIRVLEGFADRIPSFSRYVGVLFPKNHHKFPLHISLGNPHETVILFAFAKRRAVNISCEEAYGGQYSWIKGRLVGSSGSRLW